ncbi:MAG TPA: UDP-2,4-diacetamido-2,4,6-trideoxy-beta-L-altropyranose hydrolase [Azospirillum sp.]|nr:UDP-2,4-diacetamido-2,4,6-trideoxy-beta-L-altropyranose hydrolase [Azospirillum sp.]
MTTAPCILVRADASPDIGSGHIMRCLTIGNEIKAAGGRAVFACAAVTPALAARIAEAGHACRPVDGAPGSPDDAGSTMALARSYEATGLILDGYAFGAVYRRQLRESGRPILALDDLAAEELFADIVLNPAPSARPGDYAGIAEGAQLLLGPDFALVRPEVLAWRDHAAERSEILVTFGGSDPLGLTAPVAEWLQARLPGVPLRLIVGGSARDGAAVVDALHARFPQTTVEHDVPDLGLRIRQARLAVSAAGSTMYELAALGCPSLLVIVAENQEKAALAAAAEGWARSIDGRTPDAAPAIARTAEAMLRTPDVLQDLGRRAQERVDGRGAARVAEYLITTVPAP